MSHRQIKLQKIYKLQESNIPEVEDPTVAEVISNISNDKKEKAKIRKIFNIIDEDKDLARADVWSDQFIEQFYAVHVIIRSLSDEFDKNTFVKYFETLRRLFEQLKKKEAINVNTAREYKYIMGQHREKFTSSTNLNEIIDITTDNETEMSKAIIDATIRGGLTQAELHSKIHPKSLNTLTKPRPYIIINEPVTGPRKRPYLGDASLLLEQLETVDAQETDRINKTDEKRAVITDDGKPLTTYQIRYRLDRLLDSQAEELNPSDLTEPWRREYIDGARQARRTVVGMIKSHQTAKLQGDHFAWMGCLRTLIDHSMRKSWPDLEPSHDKIVPDSLTEKIDDEVEYMIETANIDDIGDQSNYIRSSLIAGVNVIGRLVTAPLLSASHVISESIERGHSRSVAGAILFSLSLYIPMQTVGLIMLSVPLPKDPTALSTYDIRLKILAVVWLIIVGINSIPQLVDDSSYNSVNLAKLGMLSHAVGLAMLRGDVSDRLLESVRELK